MERWKYILGSFVLVVILVWLAVFQKSYGNLHLVACDVGQGDAILALYGRIQILVDGGPDRRVLDCLAKHLPFWDREIELVILTHPQRDHYGGLIEVLKSYQIDNFASAGLDSSSQDFKVLRSQVGSSGAKVINTKSGMSIELDLIHLDILWPTGGFLALNSVVNVQKEDKLKSAAPEDVLGIYTSNLDPNEFSVVAILRFKNFDALLTGDIGPKISNQIAQELALSGSRRVEYIKTPHHGSKNGLTQELLDISAPEIAVISVGKNSYGHPHEETLKILRDKDIKILRTDEEGDIDVVTDGQKWWID